MREAKEIVHKIKFRGERREGITFELTTHWLLIAYVTAGT
jgi:hypothetical protein